jgi:hypothetical protein
MQIFYVDESGVITPQDADELKIPQTRREIYDDLGVEFDADDIVNNEFAAYCLAEDLADNTDAWQAFIEEERKLPRPKRVLKVSRAKKSEDGEALPRHCCWMHDGKTLFEFDEPAPDKDTVEGCLGDILKGARGSLRAVVDMFREHWLNDRPDEQEEEEWVGEFGSCFNSFDGLSEEDRDALVIRLVDGVCPGNDAQYAELCMSVDGANAVAAERRLDIRFVKQA